jgi:heptaprenyl diphosphate synthase
MKNRSLRITTFALTVSVAMLLSYIESRLPAFVAIPGIKVGLANIAVIFTLYKFGIKEAAAVSAVRVLLVSMLFGSPVSLIYSITGAVLSLSVMFLLKKLTPLSEITVSVAGGVTHNIGQIGAASVMLGTNVVVYYLPFLLLSGTIAGVVVGIASGLLIKKIDLGIGGKKISHKRENAPEENTERRDNEG